MASVAKIIGGSVAVAAVSFAGAYQSARGSYQPQPPAPSNGDLVKWVISFEDPLAISLLVLSAITAGISIWQAITGLSRKDVEEVVTGDGDRTRVLVDEGIAQTWTEGQASEARDDRILAGQNEQGELLRRIVASQEQQAAERDVNAAKLTALAAQFVDKVADPDEAERALHQAIDGVLKLRDEALRGTNFGVDFDQARLRIFARVEDNDFAGAEVQGDEEYRRLSEQADDLKAARISMADTNLSVARLAFDAKRMAHWALEANRLREGVVRLPMKQMLKVQAEWYENASRTGMRLEMDVAIEIARMGIAASLDDVSRAVCQIDLGNALQIQGTRLGGEAGVALLGDAVAAYRAALEVYTQDALPAQWAMTQNNLGVALQVQGERLGGEAGVDLLGEAVTAYRAALEVRTQDALPVQWAMTQNNLGTALSVQGERLGGEAGVDLLGEAVTAYSAALEVYTQDALPAQWAMTQENLGLAEGARGDLTSGEARIGYYLAAERAFLCALEVFDPDNMPFDHSKCTAVLARVRAKLAQPG